MSLQTVQQALAHIYTNSKLRDEFLTNPDVVGRTLNLTCLEIQQLSTISTKEINIFASSLKYKRLGEVRKLLPLTVKLLGDEFNKLFFSYAETFLPSGNKKHLKDAIAFIKFILQQEFEVNWNRDIIRYEYLLLQRLNTKKLILGDRFNYPIPKLINSLEAVGLTVDINP